MELSSMTTALFSKLFCTAAALMYFTFAAPSLAGPPDFSICDGLSGAGWGLCRAGVATGCADSTGNAIACGNIEDQFLQVTGNYPPWIITPVTCPCDYDVIDKTNPPWGWDDDAFPLQFSCFPHQILLLGTSPISQGATSVSVVNFSTGQGPFPKPGCGVQENGITIQHVPDLTTEEYEACTQEVIDYAQAFMALNPEAPVDDVCTPTL